MYRLFVVWTYANKLIAKPSFCMNEREVTKATQIKHILAAKTEHQTTVTLSED